MAFNSKYTGEQIEEGIKKSLEAMDFNGASVNVEIVDENTPASGTVTKEEGSNRARFDFQIPVPRKQVCSTNTGKDGLETNGNGAFLIDKSMVVICDDSDTLYFIGDGKPEYAVIVYSTSIDTQYFLKFDLPANICGPKKTIKLPINSLVSIFSLNNAVVRKWGSFFEVIVPNDNFNLY